MFQKKTCPRGFLGQRAFASPTWLDAVPRLRTQARWTWLPNRAAVRPVSLVWPERHIPEQPYTTFFSLTSELERAPEQGIINHKKQQTKGSSRFPSMETEESFDISRWPLKWEDLRSFRFSVHKQVCTLISTQNNILTLWVELFLCPCEVGLAMYFKCFCFLFLFA